MAFIKVTKNKAYFKRFQTKFRRRREAKTDYYARKRLVIQDMNKYVAPKYRLIARITNSKVIAQIAYATLDGDKVIAEANSRELTRFGLANAHTSYPAAYGTGLLLARRLLKKLKLDSIYAGAAKIDGQDYDVSASVNDSKRPFKALLDIGIRRPTIGNRVFAVMKGACDGGIYVPHSTRKFPGFSKGKTSSDGKYDAEVHRKRIFGVHIDEYMKDLKKKDETRFSSQFSLWNATLKKAGVATVEALFTKVFGEVRKNPDRAGPKKEKFKPKFNDKDRCEVVTKKGKYRIQRPLDYAGRKKNIEIKRALIKKQLGKK